MRSTSGGASRFAAFPATVCALLAVAAFTAAPAVAAAPEPPETKPVTGIAATSATAHALLDPLAPSLVFLEFGFFYAGHGAACNEASFAPETPGMASGLQGEPVEGELAPLEANTEYAVCAAARSTGEETWTVATNQEVFKTEPLKPAVISESASAIKSTEAHLEATVDPENAATECHFQYGTSSVTEHEAECEQGNALEGGEQAVGATVTGLTQATTYHYRVVVKNATGQTEGEEQELETALPPDTPDNVTATQLSPTEVTLKGVLNPAAPGNPGSSEFIYMPSASECTGAEQATTPPLEATGAKEEPVEATVTELLPNIPYTACLRAHNQAGEESALSAPPVTFTLAATPVLSGEEAPLGQLSAESAVLNANVDPQGLAVSSCVFEYGSGAVGEHSTPCEPAAAALGSGRAPVGISGHIAGLTPNTLYHWRLVATNTAGTTTSVEHTFIYSAAATTLPDNRAYEMVTPPFKNGAAVGKGFDLPEPSIAADGSRVIASNIQCFAGSESCDGFDGGFGEPFEFSRTPGGWVTTPLAPPATRFPENAQYIYNADTGAALFTMPTGPGKEDEWYGESEPGSFQRIGPATPPQITGSSEFETHIPRATRDLSRIVWTIGSGGPQTDWPFDMTGPGDPSLYEYAGVDSAAPSLVGVSGGAGSNSLISECGTELGGASLVSAFAPNPLSTDGRVTFFSTSNPATCPSGSGANTGTPVPVDELYARIDGGEAGAHTVAISQPDAPQVAGEAAPSPPDANCTSKQCQADIAQEGNWRPAQFVGASEDGAKVAFLDVQQLTDQAAQGPLNFRSQEPCAAAGVDCNLYLYDADAPEGHNLIDASAGSPRPEVQAVVATAADESRIYFVAKGVLTHTPSPDAKGLGVNGEPVESGAVAQPEANNLYVFNESTHELAFLASVSGTHPHLGERERFNVTPDGRYLVFEDTSLLTRDDHAPGGQIFRYDAATERLIRVSIGAGGYNDNGNAPATGATVVEPVPGHLAGSPPSGPTMSSDGEYVYFQSALALTPRALNNVVIGTNSLGGHGVVDQFAQNVYEYHEGRVDLISDGRDAATAPNLCEGRNAQDEGVQTSVVCLLGTDRTGHNVFFSTADQLVPKDTDTQLDFYDARICEPATGEPCIAEPAAATPPCGGEDCHGIPAPTPSLLAPGSASFNGEGNVSPPPPAVVKPKTAAQIRAEKLTRALKSCRKDRKKAKRRSCEKQARKRYGAKVSAHKAAKRPTIDRSASR